MFAKELIKGTLKTIVLKLLAENGRMYGYEITQRVKEITEGKFTLTEAALYPALHKLVAEGLLTTEKEIVNGRTRKYYTLTPSGDSAIIKKLREFEDFVQMMNLILKPQKMQS